MFDLFSPKGRAAFLSSYAPHVLTVQVDNADPDLCFIGVVQAITYDGNTMPHVALWVTDFGGARKVCTVMEVRPVLYSLADLPELPGDPLLRLVQSLNFISTEDLGAGEYISQVTVEQVTDLQLIMRVNTGYQQPVTSYRDEAGYEVVDEPQKEYQPGSDYEVLLSCYGDVHWRRVPVKPIHRESFQPVGGLGVLSAFELLRELQVAFGPAAHIGQARYVRKKIAEGKGQTNG